MRSGSAAARDHAPSTITSKVGALHDAVKAAKPNLGPAERALGATGVSDPGNLDYEVVVALRVAGLRQWFCAEGSARRGQTVRIHGE